METEKHGMSGTPEYCAFIDAKKRCNNSSNKDYRHYGGRGIEFRFGSFQEFICDIGARPSQEHSLDRINNDGHYEVGNVKWSMRSEQLRNRRSWTCKPVSREHGGKYYHVTSPDGTQQQVHNMAAFCKQHGLDSSHMSKVITGKKNTHKGYKAELI